MVGTWAAALPLRSASGASTSQVSGSCGASPGSVEEALAKMRGLAGGHWVPCGVIREQEPLGWADILRMHGFVIVKLRNKDETIPPKFMRLDWGHDGFFFQTSSNDREFQSYCGSSDADLPNAAVEILMRVLPRKRIYEEVVPGVTMKRLIAAIESVTDNSYDLAIWNCNHFANLVVQCLEGRPDLDSKHRFIRTASRDSKWWNDTS